mmetsp:Transcript_10471/g.14032  ORF Transcript_10471/g.14032 Transcript_10471/m.14032 type:complete len:230 (+) Transcript_10471:67-756(+)
MSSSKKKVKQTVMEDLLGPKLLTSPNTSQPTTTALKGKSLVALYFSASWCPPCRSFSPLLIKFYEKCCAGPDGVQIVYVSSDRDLSSFNEYFGKMPWVAIPADGAGAQLKQRLAELCQIRGIPALVVIDAKTGHFVTDDARNEVTAAGEDVSKGKELVSLWKSKEAVPFDRAVFNGGQSGFSIRKVIMFFLSNPVYIVGMLYFAKKGMKYLADLGEEDEDEEELVRGEL